MFLFSHKGIGELWQDAGDVGNNASGGIRGLAHHGRASWGVVAAAFCWGRLDSAAFALPG